MANTPKTIHAEASLHRKLVLFGVQLEGYLAHFPNCHKYTLTQSIRQAYVDVYNLVTEAQKRYHKKTTLTQLDVRHEQLRMLLNLAHELGLFGYSAGRKPRLIEAPAFRDLVVQHAVYAVTSPIFERHYIATSFACRVGKGTHHAADWLQAAMRRAPRTAWVLHVDVRKFFYSIDRSVLQALLARQIKCQATLRLMQLFAHGPDPTGVPIGNLLSQTFANVYLNSLDQYCKRTLQVRDYGRYMDDSIMLAPDRATGLQWLHGIRQHLALLGLEISHYSLQPIKRGANFVGFRTWATARFVRPHIVSALRADARKGRLESIVSRLGHARRTCSLQPLLTHLKEKHHGLFDRLPQSYRLRYHPHTAPA